MEKSTDAGLKKEDFETLSEFRFRLRCFERFSENAAQAAGITPLQYLLLLHIKGYQGREWATIGELAQRLQSQPHGVVSLVSRCENAGFVKRCQSKIDRRQVQVHLLDDGERILTHLVSLHRAELLLLDDAMPDF